MANMLSEALRAVRGPLDQLIANLGSEEGESWLTEFKKFLRKEPCWVLSSSTWDLAERAKALNDRIKARKNAQELVSPLTDSGLSPEKLGLAQKWRMMARYFDSRYTGPVAWHYRNMIVFWIPRLVPGSTDKGVRGQLRLLAKLNKRFDLPSHHLTNFGDGSLLKALIQKHFELTGEKIPPDGYWVSTDTLSGGDRLCLRWREGSLFCDGGWGELGSGSLGAFALGVEEFGT